MRIGPAVGQVAARARRGRVAATAVAATVERKWRLVGMKASSCIALRALAQRPVGSLGLPQENTVAGSQIINMIKTVKYSKHTFWHWEKERTAC